MTSYAALARSQESIRVGNNYLLATGTLREQKERQEEINKISQENSNIGYQSGAPTALSLTRISINENPSGTTSLAQGMFIPCMLNMTLTMTTTGISTLITYWATGSCTPADRSLAMTVVSVVVGTVSCVACSTCICIKRNSSR